MIHKFIIANVKKEVWEFNRVFLILPVLLGGFILTAYSIILGFASGYRQERVVNGLQALSEPGQQAHIDKLAESLVLGFTTPFISVLITMQLYYFLSCLFDERRDGSSYFWRSLPVSDATTITVKLVTGALILPVIYAFGAFVTTVIGLIGASVIAAFYDASLLPVLTSAALYQHLLSDWLSIVPSALWLFPVFAWLMLASSVVQKSPFIWAVLPLILILVIEQISLRMLGLDTPYIALGLVEYFSINKTNFSTSFAATLWSKVNIIGIGFGFLAIAGTYLARTRRVN